MKNPLFKPVTAEESSELLKETLKGFDDLDPAVKEIIAGSDEDIIHLHRIGTPLRETPVAPARPMTRDEERAFEGKLVFTQVFDEPFDGGELPSNPVQRSIALQKEYESLEKTFGREAADRICSYLYEDFSPSTGKRDVIKVSRDQEYELRRSVAVSRLPGRTRDVFAEALLAAAKEREDGSFDVHLNRTLEFIKAYGKGDEVAMRAVVRQIIAA